MTISIKIRLTETDFSNADGHEEANSRFSQFCESA